MQSCDQEIDILGREVEVFCDKRTGDDPVIHVDPMPEAPVILDGMVDSAGTNIHHYRYEYVVECLGSGIRNF